MRLWILILGFTITLIAIVDGKDLLGGVKLNPLGHWIEPILVSENDPGDRFNELYTNDNEPNWGRVNYGALATYQTDVADANGTYGSQIGEADPVFDMLENSTAESTVAPTPSGIKVTTLPGIQKNNNALNSFSFKLTDGGTLNAPRHYYLQEKSVLASYADSGTVTDSSKNTKDVAKKITVMQVPYSEDHFTTDTTGVVTEGTETTKAKAQIEKSLTELRTVSKGSPTMTKLSNHLFPGSKLNTSYQNINTLLNSGAYGDAYKSGLAVAFGMDKNGNPALPKSVLSSTNARDAFQQFDHIYNSLSSGAGAKYFSKPLVDWGRENALSITHTLMVNYMIQSQFSGKNGNYKTPMSMNWWPSSDSKFTKKLASAARKSKDPYYLYAVIKPSAAKLNKDGTFPVFKTADVQPHLGYIFALYTAIHGSVWQGQNKIEMVTGGYSGVMRSAHNEMVNKIKKAEKVEVKGLSKNNPTSFGLDEFGYKFNNLVVGLSQHTTKGPKFANHNLAAAFRIILPTGQKESTSKVTLYGGSSVKVTKLDKTKYDGVAGYGTHYKAFKNTGGDVFNKWVKGIQSMHKVPIHPAVFRSYWNSGSETGAYIMLPAMVGGTQFPDAIKVMLNDLGKRGAVSSGEDILNMSKANRYILAFNLKHDTKSKTDNAAGVVRVQTGSPIGREATKNKPIVLTGYNGGETFSIADYFKVQDALLEGKDKPPIKSKDNNGKDIQLGYFNLFKDFFTIKTEADFTKNKTGKIEYEESFSKETMQKKYKDNSTKAHVKAFSPDYTKFFSTTEASEESDD